MSSFNEIKLEAEPKVIRRVKMQYFEHSTAMGLFSGLEFYDAKGVKILSAGRIKEQMPWFKYVEFTLEENERLVGIKSGRRG